MTKITEEGHGQSRTNFNTQRNWARVEGMANQNSTNQVTQRLFGFGDEQVEVKSVLEMMALEHLRGKAGLAESN